MISWMRDEKHMKREGGGGMVAWKACKQLESTCG